MSIELVPADVTDKLGARIRELREQRKLTQERLAERVGITRHFVSHLERGTKGTTLRTLIAICRVLGISLSELFLGVDGPAPAPLARLSSAIAGRPVDEQRRIFRVVEELIGPATTRRAR